MQALIAKGRIVSLEIAAQEFAACIAAKNFFDPEPFSAWCRRILVDHPLKQALILPAGTIISGDLNLDSETDDTGDVSIGAIVALGNVEITGRVTNESHDGGVFLLIAGDLQTDGLFKGAGSVVVLGSIVSKGAIFCDYCHGTLMTGGNVTAPAVISNDHEIFISGTLSGPLISSDLDNMRDRLVPDVFADPDDASDEWPDGDLIRARLAEGLPVLKTADT